MFQAVFYVVFFVLYYYCGAFVSLVDYYEFVVFQAGYGFSLCSGEVVCFSKSGCLRSALVRILLHLVFG